MKIISKDDGIHFRGRPLGLVLIAAYKGLWGTVELLAGFLVLFARAIMAKELIEDPQDILANWVFAHLGVGDARRIGAIVIVLGMIKIALAFGIWYRSWLVRNIALAFFAVAGFFAVYELTADVTAFRMAALGADLFMIYYLWKVLPKHYRHGKVA